MEMMPMVLIITMATYTLGKIAITAVPIKERQKKWLRVQFSDLLGIRDYAVARTNGKSKSSHDVDDLNAQVKVVQVLLK